jgi:putative transcriptional regulator
MKNRIKEERIRLNMTQQQLADSIKVSRQTINSIERSRYVPSIILALKISKIFKKSTNEVFELEKDD